MAKNDIRKVQTLASLLSPKEINDFAAAMEAHGKASKAPSIETLVKSFKARRALLEMLDSQETADRAALAKLPDGASVATVDGEIWTRSTFKGGTVGLRRLEAKRPMTKAEAMEEIERLRMELAKKN